MDGNSQQAPVREQGQRVEDEYEGMQVSTRDTRGQDPGAH